MLKKISIVLFVLISLIVFNWWNEKNKEKKISAQAQEQKLLTVAKQDIDRLSLSNAYQTWQLMKREKDATGFKDAYLNFSKEFENPSEWLLSYGDYRYPANDSQVLQLIDELLSANKEKIIAQGQEKLAMYGLNPEKSKIDIFKQGQSDRQVDHILTGDLNSAESFVYVANNKDEVYLSNPKLKETQTDHPQNYLKKKLISFYGEQQPKKIIIKNAKNEHYEIVHENAQWQLKKPLSILADQLAVEAMINQTELFEIKDIVVALNDTNRAEMLEKYFPKESSIVLNFIHDQQERTMHVSVEPTIQSGMSSSFLYRQGHPFIFRSSDRVPPSYFYQSKDWVVKKVFSIEPDNIVKFTVKKDGLEKTFVIKDELWVSEDEKDKTDAVNFAASYAVFVLKGKEFMSTKHDPQKKVDYHISIQDSSGKTQAFDLDKQIHTKANLSYRQGYSHTYGTHLLFDNATLEPIHNAIEAFMKKKKGN